MRVAVLVYLDRPDLLFGLLLTLSQLVARDAFLLSSGWSCGVLRNVRFDALETTA